LEAELLDFIANTASPEMPLICPQEKDFLLLLKIGLRVMVFIASTSILWSQSKPSSNSVPPTIVKDAQATSIIEQLLIKAGADAAAKDLALTAQGKITYYWAGKEVSGQATIKERGSDQVRIDSVLDSGTRTIIINRTSGVLKDASGKSTLIPFHNLENLTCLIFPYAR
jgi:hypothetical protein